MDLCEFKVSLVYKASPGQPELVTQRNPVQKNKTKPQNIALIILAMIIWVDGLSPQSFGINTLIFFIKWLASYCIVFLYAQKLLSQQE